MIKPTEQTPLEDRELAILLAGEFNGSRQKGILDDPELALLLAGEYETLRRAGALRPGELAQLLGAEPPVLDAAARRKKLLGPLTDAELALLTEAQMQERIRRRHDLRLDEATRIMSREWSSEMRRLEKIGMISPTESVLAKEKNDPKYAQALRDAKDKVWAYFQELKKVADEEARREFLKWSAFSGTNEHMAQEMIREEIKLAWIATRKFQAANARFDEASVEACLDLIRTGVLRRGELIAQQLQDPLRRRRMEERLDPLRQRLWQERNQIIDEHRTALAEACDKIREKYLALARSG